MRVLLVEDDLMIGESVQTALKSEAYATDWVQDGAAALRSLDCQHYDVMLLDLGLPGLDGLSVLTQLRAKNNDIPVVIISARDQLHHRVQGLDGGADDYLLKPFEMAELSARIRAARAGTRTRC